MANFFSRLRSRLNATLGERELKQSEEARQEYVELDTTTEAKRVVIVKKYALKEFADVKPIIDALREGYHIALVNISPLRVEESIDLKRAINKLKKTAEAIGGDIAGLGEEYIIVTSPEARIARERVKPRPSSAVSKELDDDLPEEDDEPAGVSTY